MDHLEISFAPRLNLLTGDNGLGKSFLLDIVWWCMTRFWPSELNKKLTAGLMAYPTDVGKDAWIRYQLEASTKTAEFKSSFARNAQTWNKPKGRPMNPGIVFYAMADGSVAIWDSVRNYWRNKSDVESEKQVRGYVFSPEEIWNGLYRTSGTVLCNGLIHDWVMWQIRKEASWETLKSVLEALSPSKEESLCPGEPIRMYLEDAREIPTLEMPYGQSVPIIHLSSGMRRIVSLAYLLIWCWNEHVLYAKRMNCRVASTITFLFDEAESHLHPRWQRTLVPALQNVMKCLSSEVGMQLILATHSPLIMSSAEMTFDDELDAWFDLDLHQGTVTLEAKTFQKQGDYSHWLMSEAFDLDKSYNIEAEKIIHEMSEAMKNKDTPSDVLVDITDRAKTILPEFDPYLRRWFDLLERLEGSK